MASESPDFELFDQEEFLSDLLGDLTELEFEGKLYSSNLDSENASKLSDADDPTVSCEIRLIDGLVPYCKSSKRRKPDDNRSESDYSSSDISLFKGLSFIDINHEQLPLRIAEAINRSDIDLIRTIAHNFLSENFCFKCVSPASTFEESGPNAFISHFNECDNSFPDHIMLTRKIKTKTVGNGVIIRCKINSSFTMMAKTPVFCINTNNVSSMMDSNASKSDIDSVRLAELVINEDGKMIHAFFKGWMTFFFNTTKRKIEYFEQTMTLSSIRGFEG